jgi:hypothetical protein
MNKLLLLYLFILIATSHAVSQQLYLPLNRDITQEYDAYLNQVGMNFHTSVKPYLMSDIRKVINMDTTDNVYTSYKPDSGASWLRRKVSYEHFIAIDSADYQLYIDPLFDFEGGHDQASGQNTHVNSRGLLFEGNLGNNFSFSATYMETQAVYPGYITSFINDTNNQIVPGQGRVKNFTGLGSGYDFGVATGYISYKASKYFNFQFGTDKNFIGEGYRSLLLSDNSYEYPFLKVTTNVWKFQYTNLFCAMEDLHNSPIAQPAEAANQYFSRKYMTAHYLSYNVSNRVNIGLFESVIFADTTNQGAFRVDYLNPIIFYRPIEYSLGSPNNVLMGGAFNFKFSDDVKFYSQLVLDDFDVNAFKHYSQGAMINKDGIQAGIKANNLFGIDKLRFQYEFNWVRPYTYSHETTLQNYGNYNQSLADPLGANFFENIAFLSYRTGRFFFEAKFNYAVYGADYDGVDFGQNIYENYIDPTVQPYGNYTTQGLFTTLIYKEFRMDYLVNPSYNMNIEVGFSLRSQVSSQATSTTNWFYIGFKTALFNHYYDF